MAKHKKKEDKPKKKGSVQYDVKYNKRTIKQMTNSIQKFNSN